MLTIENTLLSDEPFPEIMSMEAWIRVQPKESFGPCGCPREVDCIVCHNRGDNSIQKYREQLKKNLIEVSGFLGFCYTKEMTSAIVEYHTASDHFIEDVSFKEFVCAELPDLANALEWKAMNNVTDKEFVEETERYMSDESSKVIPDSEWIGKGIGYLACVKNECAIVKYEDDSIERLPDFVTNLDIARSFLFWTSVAYSDGEKAGIEKNKKDFREFFGIEEGQKEAIENLEDVIQKLSDRVN